MSPRSFMRASNRGPIPSKLLRTNETSFLNFMMCHTKKSSIPKDPSQLNIGLCGPPKKATSRLKNSNNPEVFVIFWQRYSMVPLKSPVDTFSSIVPQRNYLKQQLKRLNGEGMGNTRQSKIGKKIRLIGNDRHSK